MWHRVLFTLSDVAKGSPAAVVKGFTAAPPTLVAEAQGEGVDLGPLVAVEAPEPPSQFAERRKS